jgi:hypothetical protein
MALAAKKIAIAIAAIILVTTAIWFAWEISTFSSLSESDAKGWVRASESLLLGSTALLTLGLFGEWSDSESWKNRLLYKFSKAAVIVGVVGELLGDGGIFKAGDRVQEVQENKILELEKALRGRSINEPAFVDALSSGGPKAPISLVYLKENGEVFSFALQIQRALLAAHWKVSEPKPLSPKEMSELYRDWPGQKAQVPPAGLQFILRLLVENPSPAMLIQLMHEPEVEALQNAFSAGFEREGPGFWSIPVGGASLWQPNAPAPGEIQIAVGPKQ